MEKDTMQNGGMKNPKMGRNTPKRRLKGKRLISGGVNFINCGQGTSQKTARPRRKMSLPPTTPNPINLIISPPTPVPNHPFRLKPPQPMSWTQKMKTQTTDYGPSSSISF